MTFGHNVFGMNGYGIGNQIFRAVGTTDDFTGDKVKIWEHCMEDTNFSTGWKLELGEGEYDTETLDPDGKNDNISAIWIPEGYTLRMTMAVTKRKKHQITYYGAAWRLLLLSP